MKLLIADIRKEQHLRETNALLEFILERRADIPDLAVQLSKDIKDHSLVLPNSCIKGVEDIWEFVQKYTDPAPQDPPTRKPKTNMSMPTPTIREDVDDLQSYQKQMLDSGDEPKEVPLTQQFQQQQRTDGNFAQGPGRQKQQPANKNVRSVPQPQQSKYVEQEQELDIQAEMTRILKQGGDI